MSICKRKRPQCFYIARMNAKERIIKEGRVEKKKQDKKSLKRENINKENA